MNDIDELIRRELANDGADLDDFLKPRTGLIAMALDAFKGTMGRWVWLMAVVNIIAAGFMFWCGYEFWIAENIDDRIYWGIWLIVTATIGLAIKYWTWMEMNRTSLHREIERLELAILSLKSASEK